jgi:hypothetical protein
VCWRVLLSFLQNYYYPTLKGHGYEIGFSIFYIMNISANSKPKSKRFQELYKGPMAYWFISKYQKKYISLQCPFKVLKIISSFVSNKLSNLVLACIHLSFLSGGLKKCFGPVWPVKITIPRVSFCYYIIVKQYRTIMTFGLLNYIYAHYSFCFVCRIKKKLSRLFLLYYVHTIQQI